MVLETETEPAHTDQREPATSLVLWGWRAVSRMADTAAVDPKILTGLLGCLLRGIVPSLVARAIERAPMGRVPHPIAAARRRRSCRGITRNKRLARRRRRSRNATIS